jgi:hypothetical protein
MDQNAVDILIVHTVYKAVEKALDALEANDIKRAKNTLRALLPPQYKHSFQHIRTE